MPDRFCRYKGARRSVQMGLNMSMNLEQAREKLEHYGQQHLLRYYEELSEEQKEGLLAQIEAADMSVPQACKNREALAQKGVITPLASMQLRVWSTI